mmetsp:Transcript_18187/g.36606  ORF Transcript_18187/g.36606 Transcript_18187/m.36606 type:complete len:234 (+) Transcript_18187:1595-2296(+)
MANRKVSCLAKGLFRQGNRHSLAGLGPPSFGAQNHRRRTVYVRVQVRVPRSQVPLDENFVLVCILAPYSQVIIRRDEPMKLFKPEWFAFCQIDGRLSCFLLRFGQLSLRRFFGGLERLVGRFNCLLSLFFRIPIFPKQTTRIGVRCFLEHDIHRDRFAIWIEIRVHGQPQRHVVVFQFECGDEECNRILVFLFHLYNFLQLIPIHARVECRVDNCQSLVHRFRFPFDGLGLSK